MKPLQLCIQAFGPFAKTETVDFTKLGENPLFLINGPTGAGKSSLLDAMSFALYGVTTGGEREATNMRCDLASAELATEITFDFLLHDSAYRIIRQPSQWLPKKRGEGMTESKPTAQVFKLAWADCQGEFIQENSERLSLKGVSDVNKWAEDLTGLSSEQFLQVMVLPQGQFRELLLAKSDKREGIFSQLFQTQIYKKIEDQLKDKAAKISSERQSLDKIKQGMLKGVGIETEEALSAQLSELLPKLDVASKSVTSQEAKLAKATKAVESAKSLVARFAQLAQLKKRSVEIAGQAELINVASEKLARALQAQKISPLATALTIEKTKLSDEQKQSRKISVIVESLTAEKKSAQQAFDIAELQWKDRDKLKAEVVSWQAKQGLVRQWHKVFAQLTQKKEEHARINQQLDSYASKNNTLTEQKKQLQIKNATLQEQLTRLPQLCVDLASFEQYGKRKREWLAHQTEQQSLTKLEQSLTGKIADVKKQYEVNRNAALTLEVQWHQGQAAELAAQLEDGVACLVCGSEDHPQPAHVGGAPMVTKDQVAQARQTESASQLELTSVQNQRSELGYKMQKTSDLMSALELQLGEHNHQPIEWFEQQWRHISGLITEMDVGQQQLSDNVRLLEQVENELVELNKVTEHTQQQREESISQLAQSQADVSILEQQLPEDERNEQVVQKAIDEREATVKKLEANFEACQKNVNNISQKLASQIELAKDASERIALIEKQVQSSDRQWQSTLAKSAFPTDEAFANSLLQDAEVAELQETIANHQQVQAELKGKLDQLAEELIDSVAPDMEAIEAQLENANETKKTAVIAFNEVNARFQQLSDTHKELEANRKSSQRIDADYKVFGTLADVASGKNRNKVNLQRFVLSVLLDDVLNEASQRLQLMSKGRYTLTRKLERSKGNQTSGLDLEVVDAYSGRARPANTLSGGESFMAALSLALGLSDVVQSYSGGIRLETLFIDEGFGSLDVESLDLAIQTLVDLRASGRTIGVISHVSELKEQMQQRIDVIPSAQGSCVRVVN